MKNTRSTDFRLGKVFRLLERFTIGDFSYREPFEENGDEFDDIVRRLNGLGERIQQSGKLISDYEQRVTAIMNVLLKYTMFDFTEKADVSKAGDEIDAIALALNTLGEELQDKIRAEKKHTERLEQLAVVMETTADGVMSLDTEGFITHWNKSAERIYGFSAEELFGRNVLDLLADPGNEKEIVLLLQRVKKGEQVRDYEVTRTHRNGRSVDISLTLTPISGPGGRLLSISAIAHDITERKRSESELRENEERFRSFVEGVKDYAIIMLDPAGLVSSWNAGALSLHGFEEREVSGQHFSMFFTKEDRAAHLPGKMLKEALKNGKSMYDRYVLRKDKNTLWTNVLVTCLRDNMQQVTGFSLITRDLTETRKKDEAIRSYTRTLEQKNIELERINQELSSFTYVSSHDLQEPLRKIRTLTSRLLETENERLSESGREYFKRLESSAKRMQQLIRDIIDYASLSSQDTARESCDLNVLMNEVVERFRAELADRGGRIEVGNLCNADVIPAQFTQLMSHIVGNSMKFASEKRPPVISVKSHSEEFTEKDGSATPCKLCVIEVQDNGIGFEPHFNRQVFEVFQRLHTHEAYPGTGIGLAICKKIVENHSGSIEARGELGKGTLITLRLPLSGKN